MRLPDELSCREVVELVSDYIEGALLDDERTLLEEHLVICTPCVNYVGQVRRTVDLLGVVRDERLGADTRVALLAAFRGWKAARP
jgi:anti-sigma factor RsiW